jgi:hypothetical protein
MEFVSVEATNHILVPTAYNRVLRCIKHNRHVHDAYAQAEIHRTARQFMSPVLYIPQVYDVYNSKQYETECIYHEKKDRLAPAKAQLFPVLFVELYRFKDYMMKEGYFMRDISIVRIGACSWAIMDFSKFGYIDKGLVRFPKQRFKYTIDEAEKDYGLYLLETKIEKTPAPLEDDRDLYF